MCIDVSGQTQGQKKWAVHMGVRCTQSSSTTDIRYMQGNKMSSRHGEAL